ncbi:hypothetical protein Tco_1209427 [Tanacetum coccineum]
MAEKNMMNLMRISAIDSISDLVVLFSSEAQEMVKLLTAIELCRHADSRNIWYLILLPLRGVLEKDSAPHLTARQEQTVKLLESHKAPFRRYPECFLCLGIWACWNVNQAADPRIGYPRGGVRVVVLLRRVDLLRLRGGQEVVAEEDAYLELADPDEGTAMVRQSEEEVVTEQSKKVKKRRLQKQSDVLPAKKLRKDHPALASGTGGKTLAGLEQIRLAGFLDSFASITNLRICTTMESSSALAIPVDTTAAATTSTGAAATTKLATDADFTKDSLLDVGFSCRHLGTVLLSAFFSAFSVVWDFDDQLWYTEIYVGANAASVSWAEVEGHAAGHELELKEKLGLLYVARDALKIIVTQKDRDISLLNSRATSLASTLDDAKEDLEAGHEHGIARRSLSAVDAYNPEAAKARYVDAVKALEDVDFSLVSLLKSKKDAGMDEVLDGFLLDGPLAGLPEAAYLQPCIEQHSVPIHHAGDTTAIGEISLSFALMNVHARVNGAQEGTAGSSQNDD